MEITYLLNSGFMVKDGKTLLIFDDFEDPSGEADKAVNAHDFENLYIFVTHAHFDHFGTHIRAYADSASRYIFSQDMRRTKRVKIFPPELITYMKKYNAWESEGIKVWTYDSTDVGVSYMVEFDSGNRIFHAGDFNWWHWSGETPENISIAEKIFKKQMKRLAGLDVDVAFFPVDGRLGDSQERGVTEFVKKTDVKSIVAMHRVGYPRWQPSGMFFEDARKIPFWSPLDPGEKRIFDKGNFLPL